MWIVFVMCWNSEVLYFVKMCPIYTDFEKYEKITWLPLTLFYMEGGSNGPPLAVFWPWLFGQCIKWADFSWLCSFQQSTGPSKAIFQIFFQIFEKFCLEDTWSPKILTRNSQKSKKNPIFPVKSYFFFLNLNSTCSQLSFEVHNVSVAQNWKFLIFCLGNFLSMTFASSATSIGKTTQFRRLFLMSLESWRFRLSF